MVTKNSKHKKRGRPSGQSEKGRQSQLLLYSTAIRLFSEQGYEQTTLRQIAKEAGVSPALLYKYYPNKAAVLLAVYDQLSCGFEARTQHIPPGAWRDRVWFATHESLAVLAEQRAMMKVVMGMMMRDDETGLFSESTRFSRERVHGAFERAITGASDAPKPALATAMSHVFYVLHLGVIQWWLLDRSPNQRTTTALLSSLASMTKPVPMLLRLPGVSALLIRFEHLIREGLYGETPAPAG